MSPFKFISYSSGRPEKDCATSPGTLKLFSHVQHQSWPMTLEVERAIFRCAHILVYKMKGSGVVLDQKSSAHEMKSLST